MKFGLVVALGLAQFCAQFGFGGKVLRAEVGYLEIREIVSGVGMVTRSFKVMTHSSI